MKDFAGKPMVICFFVSGSAAWAGKDLAALHNTYGPKGLQVVGINLYEKPERVRAAMKKFAMEYPVLQGDSKTHKAWVGSNKAWAVFFVDARGRIVKKILTSTRNGITKQVFDFYGRHLLATGK